VLSSRAKTNKGSAFVLVVVIIPIFLLITGMITDIGRAFVIKEELNKACMIAAEEASKCINIDTAEDYGINNLSGEYSNIINSFFYNNLTSRTHCQINNLDYSVYGGIRNPKYIQVICEAEVDCFFLKLISIESIKVHAIANGRLRSIK
jgi:hypothetical protein